MDSVDNQEQILKEAKEFAAKEIRPFAAEFEEQGGIPRELIDKMARKGYLGASFPREWGGLGLDPVYYGLLTEEIGKACASTRGLLTVHTSLVGETLLRWGNREQKERWLRPMAAGKKIACFALTEPDVGTDARNVQTRCRKEGADYILDGKKKWITCSAIADLLLVIASGEKGITAFMVEREFAGIDIKPMRGLLAGRAAHIAEIELAGVVVPEQNIITKEGSGFSYVVNTALDHGRYSVAWGGIGIAQEALEAMVTYSRERSQFGKKIYTNQLIQGFIGDAVTKVHAGRALCLKAARMRLEGSPDAVMETTIAKYFTSKIAMEIALDAVQVHGGNGCWNKYPVERLFREAKILEIIEGTSQVQQEMIASYGLRKYFVK